MILSAVESPIQSRSDPYRPMSIPSACVCQRDAISSRFRQEKEKRKKKRRFLLGRCVWSAVSRPRTEKSTSRAIKHPISSCFLFFPSSSSLPAPQRFVFLRARPLPTLLNVPLDFIEATAGKSGFRCRPEFRCVRFVNTDISSFNNNKKRGASIINK